MERLHRPVLVNEVIENIKLFEGGTYADLTFGEGGHSDLMLAHGIKKLWANDRDTSTLERYKKGGKYSSDPRLGLLEGPFSSFLERCPCKRFDGILVDLGVSTRQLMEADRGFSLMQAGPLDMRMNQKEGESLAEMLQGMSAETLADALYYNADIRESRSLARRILSHAEAGTLNTTLDLASLAGPKKPGKSHPATALFTALRMIVNQEMDEIDKTFKGLIEALNPGGRLVVLTFHSTEDRKVKRIFAEAAGRCICEAKICICPRVEKVKLITKKPLEASEAELSENPRARSAKLRCIEKI